MLNDYLATVDMPITATQAQLLVWGAMAVILLGGINALKAVTDIVRFFRGDPPAIEKFAEKSELASLRAEVASVERRIGATLANVEKAQGEIFGELRNIHRSLGRIEGHSDK